MLYNTLMLYHPYIHFLIPPMESPPSSIKKQNYSCSFYEPSEDMLTELRWFYTRPQYQHISKDTASTFLLILKNQLFRQQITGIKLVEHKYCYIRNMMMNPFMTTEIFDTTLTMFGYSQKLYFAMGVAKVQVDTDLYMNVLSPKSKHTFPLLQDGKIYYFALSDLVRLIQNSISNSSSMFLMPIPCKNPYNNSLFRKHDLYNMYFQMRRVFVRVPALIELYYSYDFNIYNLKKYHENMLLHHVVRQELDSMQLDRLITLFVDMEYSIMKGNEVFVALPERVMLVKCMKPFLHLFMLCKYITDPYLRSNYHDELKWKLTQFHNANPEYFIVKRFLNRYTQKKRVELLIRSTPDIIEPVQTPTCDFRTTHVYDDNKYNSYIYRGYYNKENNYPDECISYQILMETMVEQSIVYIDTPPSGEPPMQRPRYYRNVNTFNYDDDNDDDDDDDDDNDNTYLIQNSSDDDDDDNE